MNKWHHSIFMLLIGMLCMLLLLVSVGCQRQESLLNKIEMDLAPEAVKEFIGRIETMNGIYLYVSGQSEQYIFLNAYHVLQGEPATFFTDVIAEVKGKELLIYVTDQQTRDYESASNNKVLFKVTDRQKFETIRLFRNNEHSTFAAIGN